VSQNQLWQAERKENVKRREISKEEKGMVYIRKKGARSVLVHHGLKVILAIARAHRMGRRAGPSSGGSKSKSAPLTEKKKKAGDSKRNGYPKMSDGRKSVRENFNISKRPSGFSWNINIGEGVWGKKAASEPMKREKRRETHSQKTALRSARNPRTLRSCMGQTGLTSRPTAH